MTTTTSSTSATLAASTASASKSTGTTSPTDASDRFLKLLVTQMQNQDPLNPMDNAQVTSQMAQINTVTGIDKLNTTMTNMGASMTQLQMLQGAALVGHSVLLEGNKLSVGTDGKAVAGYSLDAAASNVRIDVLDAAGTTVDTINQTGMGAGEQGFSWTPPTGASTTGLSFKVTATSGTTSIKSTPLMSDTVDAITNSNGTLNLELRDSGTTAYSKVKSVS
jgi:flagellar basal-body rod modification protein FlgD